MIAAKITILLCVIISKVLPTAGVYASGEKGSVFAIYQITKDAPELDRAELEPAPFISEQEIATYDWHSHTITLKAGVERRMPTTGEIGVRGKLFVIVAGGQRCYRGAWWTSLSSMSTDLPVINIMEQHPGELRIDFGYPESIFHAGPDLRVDLRVHDALLGVHQLME